MLPRLQSDPVDNTCCSRGWSFRNEIFHALGRRSCKFRRRCRWEYTVQFHTGINHDGFDHYPNAGQRPAFIFMFFAKERDVPATSGEHKLIGFAVTPLPTNLPTNGNQMRFRNIPIHRVNLHFKPVGGKNTGKSNQLAFSIRLRHWESDTFVKQLMTGEHGEGDIITAGVANWMAAASCV